MGADMSVVKKKHWWNLMADEEWMEKHQDMKGKGEKAMDTNMGVVFKILMLMHNC